MACGITDPVGCVGDVFGGAARSVADSAFSAIAHDFGQAADSVVKWLWKQTSAATTVSLGGKGFATDLAITASIAATIGLGLFAIQIVASVVRREPGGLARAGRGLLVAFVAGAAAIAVVNLLLAAVDDLSAGVVQVATGGSINQMGNRILAAGALSGVSNPAAVILLSLVVVAATVVVWAALMVRKLLIIVAAVFAPIAFAGSLADITAAWVRRWIETMVALVVSKLILVLIFAVGLGVLVDGVGESPQAGVGHVTETVTQTVTGALILVMAGFAPWLAIKLVHFAGDSFHTIHAHAGAVHAGAATVASAPQRMNAMASKLPHPGQPTGRTGPPGTSDGGAGGTNGPNISTASGVARTRSGSSSGAASAGGAAAAGAAGAVLAVGTAAKRTVDKAADQVDRASASTSPPDGTPPSSTSAEQSGPAKVRPVRPPEERSR
jgi:type IV secretion system protein TrbL